MPEGTAPAEILREQNPDAIPADAPPEASNYRPADVQGIACAFCSKFRFTGEAQDESGNPIPTGYCSQWEANVRGDFVSDAFADPGPPLDESGNEVWDFADAERSFAEIHLAGADTQEESGFVVKEVLRTGEWPAIPTKAGVIKKPLRIIRDGRSSKEEGTIALAELVENFKAGAIGNPQIPLSDDEDDHKNITRVNTGFVRDLWIVDEGDSSKLVAKMEFTEPEVKDKVLRGTYADVSCGIPWRVRSRGQEYGAVLEHVAITNRPFIDGLGPFLAASDKPADEVEVSHFGDTAQEDSTPRLSLREIEERAKTALLSQGLTTDYSIADVQDQCVRVVHAVANTSWTVPYSISADGASVQLAAIKDWTVEEEGQKDEPPARKSGAPRSSDDELAQARSLRELRFSQQPITKRAKEDTMPLTREDLDRLELSDEARAAFQNLLEENSTLRATTRETEAESRIVELSDMGLKERPGALKFYRQVFLSDDGGPAAVLLSDNGQEKESLTAIEVLDRFIEGIKGSDGKLTLSDQHLASGNDDPPPANADGEVEAELPDRVAEARAALYGNSGKK